MENSTLILITVLFTLALIILGWIIVRIIKKRKGKFMAMPEDVLNDFNKAERIYAENHGEIEPHAILWQIAKEKSQDINIQRNERRLDEYGKATNEQRTAGRTGTEYPSQQGTGSFAARNSGTPIQRLPQLPAERKHFQNAVIAGVAGNQAGTGRSKADNRKGLFGRRR